MTQNLLILFLSIFLSSYIFADNVIMKDGTAYENVKTSIEENYISIIFPSRVKKKLPKKMVKTLKIQPVKWPTIIAKKDIEEERIRAIEFVMEHSRWQPKEQQKPRLAIFPFEAGKGISEAEAKLYSKLIKTSLIQKRIFRIIDETSFTKALNDKKCKDKKCAEDIASELKANKLLTGSITHIRDSFYINADVVDIQTKSIDFSETIVINNKGDISGSIDTFTKVIAGGTLEFWSYETINPDQGEPSHIPYLWRSAVFPGWGQFHQNRKWSGFLYSGFYVSGLAYIASKNGTYQNKYNSYKASMTFFYSSFLTPSESVKLFSLLETEAKNKDLKQASRSAEIAVGITAAIYVINLIDALIVPIRKSTPEANVQIGSPSPGMNFNFFPDNSGSVFQSSKVFYPAPLRYNLSYTMYF
ncbi:MAG: hypothetical protein H7A25_14510 [Leptospiraceae bacterium]|nr:hypothetical protein [Leptospiraceae bacterium]